MKRNVVVLRRSQVLALFKLFVVVYNMLVASVSKSSEEEMKDVKNRMKLKCERVRRVQILKE